MPYSISFTASTWAKRLKRPLSACLLAGGVALCLPGMTQTIAQLSGNEYQHSKDLEGGYDGCRYARGSSRAEILRLGESTAGLTKATMHVTHYTIRSSSCRQGTGRSWEIREVTFREDGGFQWVVTSTEGANTFEIGYRQKGTWEVLNGGRSLILYYNGYPSDVTSYDGEKSIFQLKGALSLAAAPPPPAPPPPRHLIPNRQPDLVLQCRPVSVVNVSISSTRGSNNEHHQSGGTVQTSCQSTGWENERRSISIWMSEQRCNGFLCQINEQSISFEGVSLDRFVGQYRDTCFVYQCERVQDARRRF